MHTIIIEQTITRLFSIFFNIEVIIIYEVIASIIWWVYINHLDFAKIVLSEYFEHIKIIALNINILSIPKIN